MKLIELLTEMDNNPQVQLNLAGALKFKSEIEDAISNFDKTGDLKIKKLGLVSWSDIGVLTEKVNLIINSNGTVYPVFNSFNSSPIIKILSKYGIEEL